MRLNASFIPLAFILAPSIALASGTPPVAEAAGPYSTDEGSTVTLGGTEVGSRLRWGFSVSQRLGVDDLEAMLVAFGAAPLGSDEAEDASSAPVPAEFLLGVRYRAPFGLRVQLAGGSGLGAAMGNPEFRILGQIGIAFGIPKPKYKG
ncbi:MAG: hypothetical protein GY898_06650 [Proteobacteria bacterium]|nr:hypothetical protein [Pseudomonadota bacterium]